MKLLIDSEELDKIVEAIEDNRVWPQSPPLNHPLILETLHKVTTTIVKSIKLRIKYLKETCKVED